MNVTGTLNVSAAVAGMKRFQKLAPQGIARALNRAATTARAVMAREVATDLGIRVSKVKDQITIESARSDMSSPTVRIVVTGTRIKLIEFNAKGPVPSRGRGRGVTARLPGGKGRYPNAFIATMRSGHVGVFQRVPHATRHGAAPHRPQLPIYELRGPSMPHVFAKHMEAGLTAGQEAVRKNLERELSFALRQSA